ncbi:hypothetical protein MHU86_6035 [Fragilaria crotonensis]|nr:hypothetical protein MHU86_6035 [Fragilaria crotonensis]
MALRAPSPPSKSSTVDANFSSFPTKRTHQVMAFFLGMIPFTIYLLLNVPRIATCDDQSSRPTGRRFFPPRSGGDVIDARDESCHAGRLCVGPGTLYPLGRQVGALFSSLFTVPDLPQEHDPVDKFTYYDYFNIFWPTAGLQAASATNSERPAASVDTGVT